MKSLCVVKVGGALVDSQESLNVLSGQLTALTGDWSVIVVHGGGPQATRMAKQYGHSPRIVEGRRVTTSLDLEIIQATVCGLVNTRLVGAMNAHGVKAVGFSGASASTVEVVRRPPWEINGEMIDFGFVGDIKSVHPAAILALVQHGYVPVVASLGIDASGQTYNVNADTTAAEIAVAVGADRLLLVTDSGGLYRNDLLVQECDEALFSSGRQTGWISGGMIVKLKTGLDALKKGVPQVRIVASDAIASGAGTKLVQHVDLVEAQ